MKKMMMSVMVMIMTSSMTVMGNTVTKSDKHNDGHNNMEVVVDNHNNANGMGNMDKGGKTYDMGKGMNDDKMDKGKMDKGHDHGKNDMHKGGAEHKKEHAKHVDDVTAGVVVGTVIVGTVLTLLH